MIFIIIPVHNRKEYTRDCLLSLRKQTYQSYKAVVIDDGSSDNTGEMLEAEFPEVCVIKGNGNLWWAAATNLGVKYAIKNNADFILTLNNDTITTCDFLEKMIYWSEKNPDSLLGAFALNAETKKPVYGGEIIDWKFANYKSLLENIVADKRFGLYEVTHFPGRGLLIPAEVFKKIGLFDEKNFPHYAADYDFTHRAIKAGYKVYCNYDSKLYIYPDVSGDAENRKKKNIKNYYNHLFGIKGGGNIFRFTKYAVKNCPQKYFLQFLIIGCIRRIIGYIIKRT